MKIKILLSIIFVTINLIGQKMNLNILPTPQKIEILDQQNFQVDHSTKVLVSDLSNTELLKGARHLKYFLDDKLKTSIKIEGKADSKNSIFLNLIKEFQSPDSIPKESVDEAYILTIENNQIVISGVEPRGIYYGCVSLIQLLEDPYNKNLKGCKIIDWPNMKIRGISDDFSRGQVSTLENFKRIISFISKYKMNTYMPYMEDVIQFENFPEIGVGRGALSKKEIREIIQFADEHFVEVIPIFQTLGHYENILSQPEFIQYADFPGGASLDVTNPKTYIFLEKMLEEVFELFPSKYIHIGGDESYDVGLGNSRKLLENSDLAEIHSDHYKKVYDICKRHNKQVMMYGDIPLDHQDILNKIPKDITIVDWHYHPEFNYPSTKIFNKGGFNYIVSPSVWNFSSAFPENFFAVPNIQTIIEDGINNNSIGMINSSWGDFGAETFREYNLYGYAWSAQCSWNNSSSEINAFDDLFFQQFFGTDSKTVKSVYDDLVNPTNQMLWGNLWRHPLLNYRANDWRQFDFPQASKYYSMKASNSLLENIDQLKKVATRNKEFIDLLEFTARLKDWFVLKQETQIYLHDILDSNSVDENLTLKLIDKNISDLNKLKKEYSILWTKYNREDNLWMVEEKFNRMIAYFNETKEQINRNKLQSALISSDWIYYPIVENEFIWDVKFSKIFNINDKIKSAQLQIIGDTFAKLYINDKEVDSVFTKRSGSLWVEQQRIKLIDVSKFLKQGENKILVESKNYYDERTPGINIFAQIITDPDTIYLKSDKTWKVKNNNSDEWIEAEVRANTLEIIEPNFNTKRKSWIER